MKISSVWVGFVGLLLALSLPIVPAHAQATRTWISGVGDDANPCSRTAPCKTFAGAIAKTTPNGQIDVLDPGGFGAITITKAITLASEGFEGGVLVSGTNGINVSAGPNDVVILRGLDIYGLGTGLVGVRYGSGAALHIEKCLIRGFNGGSAIGVQMVTSTGAGKLFISDTIISENGIAGNGLTGGVFVVPTGGSGTTAAVTLQNVRLENNFGVGLRADATSSGAINTAILHSRISGNGLAGVAAVAVAAGTPSFVVVDSSSVSNNGGAGFAASGTGATINISRSIILGNGSTFGAASGGAVGSYADNDIENNGGGNALPPGVSHH
jgi:hypothetical protein